MARAKSRAATEGMTITELVKTFGLSRKAVHDWVAKGLLAPPVQRGPRTAYDEAQVLRLRAIQAMRRQKMGVPAIKRWLLSATRDQVEALLSPPPPAAPAQAPAAVPQVGAPRSEKWERAVLVPGLELNMRLDAPPVVRRMAQEIFARYSVLAVEGE